MPPELRLRIAHRFWQVLRVQATTPVSAGGLGVVARISTARAPISHSHRTPRRRASPPPPDGACVLVSASADFKQKATAYLCLGQFRYFNRSRVEVFLYASRL